MKLMLDARELPRVGQRILHLAPEQGLGVELQKVVGDGYEPRDLTPERYRRLDARKIDLIEDAENLPSETYDLIIHSHVMEHVPCNITAVLWHLHRALKPDGWQICSIPILGGNYSEDWGPMSDQDRTAKFGQFDHVRRFGRLDMAKHLGMLFHLPEAYDISKRFGRKLKQHNVPKIAWQGWTSHSVLELHKSALKLR